MNTINDGREDPRRGQLESRLVDALRRKQHSYEKLYVAWYKRYVRFHQNVHPAEMGVEEIEAFLSYLAREKEEFSPVVLTVPETRSLPF